MGWETAIFAALSVASSVAQASSANKQAKAQAKATIAEGNIVASNKAKDVARLAASQRVSFLNSGLTLEGTPMNVIDSTFNTGLDDINQISANYNAKAKNQISAGRSAAISSLASGLTGAFSSAAVPNLGVGDFFTDVGNGLGTLSNGQGFSFGYDVSQSFRNAGGGFGPGEFK